MVLTDANVRVALTLDYDPSERYMQRAVAVIASLMAKENTPWALVIEELKKLKPSETKSQSLAQQLIAEDLLMRVPGLGEECVRFRLPKIQQLHGCQRNASRKQA